MFDQLKTKIAGLFTYGTLKFFLVLLLLLGYVVQVEPPDTLFSWVYALTLPSYYYAVVFLLVILLFPIYLIPRVRYLYVVLFFLFDFYLIIDAMVCNVYKFHINQTLISMFFFDFKGMGVPPYLLGLSAVMALLLFLTNLFLFRWSLNRTGRFPVILFPLFMGMLLVNQGIHMGASGLGEESVTRYTPRFPFFYPLTSASTVRTLRQRFPDLFPVHEGNRQEKLLKGSKSGGLHYPLKAPTCSEPAKKYDIIFFLTESWRSDMMNKEVTPNIYALSKKSYVYTNHISGGNSTVQGLFSLVYGLHPSYMENIRALPHKYPPVLMETLKQQGYESYIYTSSNLERFSLREMFFNERDYKNYYYMNINTRSEDDREVIEALTESIRKDKSANPSFRLIFLTSSHSDYDYPKSHHLFKPTSDDAAFVFNKQVAPEPYLNDYKNSLHYVDALFGEMIQALKEAKKLDSTVIVVSSDHGEEFNDNGSGYWGHGSNFTRSQSSVPLVVYYPFNNEGHLVQERSGHIDVVPTLLSEVLNCDGDYSDYSSGVSLFHLPEHRGLVVGNYINFAYIIDDQVYAREFTLESYDVNDVSRKNKAFDYAAIRSVLNEEVRFMKAN